MSLGYSYPGLAAATGTRVDSAAKHTLACRVSEPLMMTWCEDESNPRNHMHVQKMKYCMHKNDLVLNVSQSLNTGGTIVTMAKAYPSVVSNLGDMTAPTKDVISCLYHDARTGREFLDLKQRIHRAVAKNSRADLSGLVDRLDDTEWRRVSRELKDLPYFTAQGYALGIAYASNLTGDTVGTVLIGGIHTVTNGAFEMRAGQLVQWYLDEETDLFNKDNTASGRVASRTGIESQNRILQDMLDNGAANSSVSGQTGKRKAWHDRAYGMEHNQKAKSVFRIKPYVESDEVHYGDRVRVFAKCINGGRAFDHVDIMLMTQSL